MRYGKRLVNKIVDRVIEATKDPKTMDKKIELIREEYLLVDRRTSTLPAFASDVVHDFINNNYSYKELMRKYNCSFRVLMGLLHDCSKSDHRVLNEIERRTH